MLTSKPPTYFLLETFSYKYSCSCGELCCIVLKVPLPHPSSGQPLDQCYGFEEILLNIFEMYVYDTSGL